MINKKGQTIIEMAFTLPLLLLLVLGIMEFGRALYVKNTLTSAARAGIRTAVVTPVSSLTLDSSGVTLPADCNSIDNSYNNPAVLTTVCGSLTPGIPINQVSVKLEDETHATISTGDTIKVTVT